MPQDFLRAEPDLPPVIVISGIGRDVLAAFEVTHGNRLFACRSKPVPPTELIALVRAPPWPAGTRLRPGSPGHWPVTTGVRVWVWPVTDSVSVMVIDVAARNDSVACR